MPCALRGDASIPLAQSELQNVAMKNLSTWLGGAIRCICRRFRRDFKYSFPRVVGVSQDINFSPSSQRQGSYRSDFAFCATNRVTVAGVYLFGTRRTCRRAFCGREITWSSSTRTRVYERYGTSLRMRDIGDRNKNQAASVFPSKSWTSTCAICRGAISTRFRLRKIGVKVDGEYQQNQRQHPADRKANYYSFIRPKRLRARRAAQPRIAARGSGPSKCSALDVSAFDFRSASIRISCASGAFLALVCAVTHRRSGNEKASTGLRISGCCRAPRTEARLKRKA